MAHSIWVGRRTLQQVDATEPTTEDRATSANNVTDDRSSGSNGGGGRRTDEGEKPTWEHNIEKLEERIRFERQRLMEERLMIPAQQENCLPTKTTSAPPSLSSRFPYLGQNTAASDDQQQQPIEPTAPPPPPLAASSTAHLQQQHLQQLHQRYLQLQL